MSAPPQVTAPDEVGIVSLSDVDLARLWIDLSRAKLDTRPVLREFDRRFWVNAEEAAAAGALSIPPAWRPLRADTRAPSTSDGIGVRAW